MNWFLIGCMIEGGLLAAAAILSFLFNLPLFADLHWSWRSLALGLVACVPPFLFFQWLLSPTQRHFAATRHALEGPIRRMFENWSLAQFAAISLLAGIGEEALFRAIVQGGLKSFIGPGFALLLASLVFGCFHLVNLEYALVTMAMGVYLGGLWMASGNLLAPIITHGVYDFVALVYFLRFHARPQNSLA